MQLSLYCYYICIIIDIIRVHEETMNIIKIYILQKSEIKMYQLDKKITVKFNASSSQMHIGNWNLR